MSALCEHGSSVPHVDSDFLSGETIDCPGPKDYRASTDPALQPYVSPTTGEVVTLTPDQCSAIFRALDIWLAVAGPGNDYLREAVTTGRHALTIIHAKSCLLGRILYDGKPPLVDAPPTVMAGPDYSLEVPR